MSSIAIHEITDWVRTSHPPILRPGGLHLWKIRTGVDGASLAELSSLLSRHESERAGRLRHQHHRERYIRTHAALRSILASYLRIEAQRIVFHYSCAGKPRVEEAETGVEFNLTTSGDLALLAISDTEAVGVDCEQVRARRDLQAIAERMFSPEEASRLAATAPEYRLQQFHLSWTALEAGVKADGRGLSRRREPAAQGALDIEHCIPEPGFIAAVARRDLSPLSKWETLEPAVG
jgi:4'-phosphopantetheinyl transferase